MFISTYTFMQREFKYVDLLNDEVFKLVFGRESAKDIMIGFLNQIISDRNIVDLDFMDKEMKSEERGRKDSVFDMFCRTDDGSRIIVEVQRRKQPFYAERTLYYSTFQINRQVAAGAGDYSFCPVYVVNILDFNMDENVDESKVRTVYRLYEEDSHNLLTDKLTLIFLELKKFDKSLEELNGDVLDGIYYCLKHMPSMDSRPEVLGHEIFRKIFEVSELLGMDEVMRSKILEKMTTERDLRNQMAYARKVAIEEGLAEGLERGLTEGRAKGRAEGRAEGSQDKAFEIAGKMKALGVDVSIILQASGLTEEQVASL